MTTAQMRLRIQRMVKSRVTILGVTISLTVAMVIFYFCLPNDYTVRLPSYIDVSHYKPLLPEVKEDFPTIPDGPIKIPHILHQTSKSTCVFKENVKYMKSFQRNNEDWKYYFWTDETARALIADKYSDILHMYDAVTRGVKKGDILRYVVMYEYGGVYADTDIENLRPLDRVTRKYSCILPTEPVEQSALLRGIPYMMTNAIMLCSPKHPFFKMLLDNIVVTVYKWDVVAATGPKFVTQQFDEYNKYSFDISMISSEDLRMKELVPIGTGSFPADDKAAIYVPNTHYFTNDLDIKFRGTVFVARCKTLRHVTDLHRRACVELQTKGLVRKDQTFTYTKHHWHHSWAMGHFEPYFKTCVEISTFIPNILYYNKSNKPLGET